MKILHMCSGLDGGGIERLLFDYYSRMNRENIQFDFVKVESGEGILEQPLKDMSCKIFSVPPLRGNFRQYSNTLRSILANGKYDAIHCHGGYRSTVALKIAKQAGIPIRIAHSHTAFEPENFKQKIIRKSIIPFTKYYATDLFACGKDAGIWMWGKKADVYIIHNGINVSAFKFNEDRRKELRHQLGVEDKFVIGNVARFSYQKNHEFLINIFSEIKKMRPDAVLLLVGRGEIEDEVKRQVSDMGLSDSVIFLGVRNDVSELLNAMDTFVLPSRFEGLPVTLVEVQANGLMAYASASITDEIKIGDQLEYIPLSESPKEWANKICDRGNQRILNGVELVYAHGYEINTEAEKLTKKYNSLLY